MDKNGFHQEYYFPYFRGTGVTSREDLMVEKHGSQESFAGVMEDARVGVSLIFYVQNAVAYKKACVDQMLLNQPVSTTFSGLSDKGEILLPARAKSSCRATGKLFPRGINSLQPPEKATRRPSRA